MKGLIVFTTLLGTAILGSFVFMNEASLKMTTHLMICIYLARNGYFRSEGISGFGAFEEDYRRGRISGKDIVRAAINSKRLSPGLIDDREYIRSVNEFFIQQIRIHWEHPT